MRILLIILSLFLLSANGFSSETSVGQDQGKIDALTYRYFIRKQWDSVLMTGKQALKENIDFYYLRVRMGVACFEKELYYPAVTHLKKAHQENPSDNYVNNYLYYAFRYTNQLEEASLLLSAMSPESVKALESRENVVELTYVAGGYTFSSAASPGNLATLMENDSIYGEQDLYGDNLYSSLGLNLRATSRLRFNIAYNFLNFQKTKYIQYGRGEDQLVKVADSSWGKMYLYNFPWVVYDTSFKYTVYQHEIHLGATISPGSGFRIMPAFHLVNVGYTSVQTSYRFDTVNDPSYYTDFDSTLYTFPFARLNYTFSLKDTAFSNWVASLKVTKDLGVFNVGLSGSFSNLNGLKQKQIGISFTYFPLGNLNFYGTTSGIGFFQKKDQRLLLSQVLGTKVSRWLWAEGNIHYGDFTNANILNGSIVFNSSDRMKYRAGGTLIFIVGKKMQLSLVYQFAEKESLQYYYIKQEDPETKEISEIQKSKYNHYQTNSIIGGITWKL